MTAITERLCTKILSNYFLSRLVEIPTKRASPYQRRIQEALCENDKVVVGAGIFPLVQSSIQHSLSELHIRHQ